MIDEKLLAYLEGYVTENRKQTFELKHRRLESIQALEYFQK